MSSGLPGHSGICVLKCTRAFWEVSPQTYQAFWFPLTWIFALELGKLSTVGFELTFPHLSSLQEKNGYPQHDCKHEHSFHVTYSPFYASHCRKGEGWQRQQNLKRSMAEIASTPTSVDHQEKQCLLHPTSLSSLPLQGGLSTGSTPLSLSSVPTRLRSSTAHNRFTVIIMNIRTAEMKNSCYRRS